MPCASRSPMPFSKVTPENAPLIRLTSACISGWSMAVFSAGNQPAIHVVRLAGNVIGVGTGKEYRHAGDVFGGFGAFHRDISRALLPYRAERAPFMLAPLTVNLFPHVGSNRPGADAVYRQVWRKFHCGSLSNIDRSCLAGGVGTQHRPSPAAGDGCNVDDFAAWASWYERRLPKHLAGARLQGKK